MDFDFSEDQRRLQEEVARMLGAVSTSSEVRQVLEGRAPYSAATWRQLTEMGAAAAAIPEAYGGSGLGRLELCLVAEEAGRSLAAAPLLSSIYLAAEALLLAGDEAQKTRWLPKIARGELIATACLVTAERALASQLRFAGAKLDGTVDAVPDGGAAGLAVVLAGEDLVLVELDAPGVTRTPQRSLDPTRPLAQLRFEAVAAEPLGARGAGRQHAERVLQHAAVLTAFEQVGGAERALTTARDYALERRAFGRPIGSFQAVKHKLVDIYVAKELARAHAYYGAWALASGAPELPGAAAAARVAATRAYDLAAEEGLETHGGIGYTWEMDCHLHLRRARWLGQILGSQFFWSEQLADAVLANSLHRGA